MPGAFDFSAEHLKGLEIFSQLTLKRYTRGHPVFVYWNRTRPETATRCAFSGWLSETWGGKL